MDSPCIIHFCTWERESRRSRQPTWGTRAIASLSVLHRRYLASRCCFVQSNLHVVIPDKSFRLEVAIAETSPTSHSASSLASLLTIPSSVLYPLSLWCLPRASDLWTQLGVTLCPSQEASSPQLLAALLFNPISPSDFTHIFCSTDLKAFNSICKFPVAY